MTVERLQKRLSTYTLLVSTFIDSGVVHYLWCVLVSTRGLERTMAVKFTKLQNVDLDDTTGTEGEEEGDGGGRKEEGGKVRLIPEEQPNGEPMFNCESKRRWRWWWSFKHRIKRSRLGRCCWVNSWRTVLIAFVVFFATVVISLLVSKLAKEPTREETFLLTQGEYTHTHTCYEVEEWKKGMAGKI